MWSCDLPSIPIIQPLSLNRDFFFFFFNISIAQENMLYLQIIKQLENLFFLCTGPLFFFLNYLFQDPTSASPSLLKLTASPRPPGIEGTGGRPASLYRWQITQAQSETLRKEKASIKNSSLAHSSTLQTPAQPSLGTRVSLWKADYSNVIISHSQ